MICVPQTSGTQTSSWVIWFHDSKTVDRLRSAKPTDPFERWVTPEDAEVDLLHGASLN
jgi:hypothetical protein